MAQRTGLEPATPGVTGRYSNQLNYRCLGRFQHLVLINRTHSLKEWWVMTDSNRRHSACKADALPTELITLRSISKSSAFQLRKRKSFKQDFLKLLLTIVVTLWLILKRLNERFRQQLALSIKPLAVGVYYIDLHMAVKQYLPFS